MTTTQNDDEKAKLRIEIVNLLMGQNATIERCAQRAQAYWDATGDFTQVIAAIRALKDKK